MNRAVFLDRDGVLTRALVRDGIAYAPRTLAEMEIDADAPAALARLKAAGFLLVMVTNQPDVPRGITRRQDVERMHATLRAALPLDACFVCYHDDGDACDCRKPRPGMLLQAAVAHAIDLAQSYMIGDRWRDIDAGDAAGCRTIWIDRGYRERAPEHTPDARVDSLRAAADWILARRPARLSTRAMSWQIPLFAHSGYPHFFASFGNFHGLLCKVVLVWACAAPGLWL